MQKSDPRKLAFEILGRVDEGAYADLALDAALNKFPTMDGRDRALATELVYGTLRYRGRIDFALSRCYNKKLSDLEHAVLRLLRLGAYQVLQLDRVPDRAAVHETVELAKRQKLSRATGLINAVLRALVRKKDGIAWPDPVKDPLGYLADYLSLPRWLARNWLDELGAEEAFALGEALLQPAPFTLRVNTLKTSRDEFLHALGEERGAEATRYAPEGVVLAGRGSGPLPGEDEGWYQVQDEASMIVSHLLAPKAGDRILDSCSAPGGKTTHLAALTGNKAQILALDLHPKRARLVAEGARRLGCSAIEAKDWDLTVAPDFLEAESFDRVLVDAPCSGLGVLRRNPEARWRRFEFDVDRLAELQKTILGNVAPLVRPGGVLLYSLCTLTIEETTGVTEAFLAAHPDFVQEDLRPVAGEALAELISEDGCMRTQTHRHGGMDAFFAARFRRKG